MNRTSRGWTAGGALWVLLGAAGAGAQEATPAPRPEVSRPEVRAPETLAPTVREVEPPTRMRGSHTVDVIAPGEKVDTILGRMRPERPQPPPRTETVRPPPGAGEARGAGPGPGRTEQARPLEGGRDEGGRDNGRDMKRPAPPPGARPDGAPPPPSSPRPPPR